MATFGAINDANAAVKVYCDIDGMALVSATGTEELSRLFQFELVLISERDDVTYSDLVGTPLTLEMNTYGNAPRYFSGIITQLNFLGGEYNSAGEAEHFRYAARMNPWLWQLTQTNDCRIFQNQTAQEIVEAVFRDSGMTDFEFRTQGTFATREYCVQYRESDFNFVSRLLEEEGIYYYFEHGSGVHRMILVDDVSQAETCPDYATVEYRLEHMKAIEADDALGSWMPVQGMQPGKYASADYDFKKPNVQLRARKFKEMQHNYPVPEPEVFDYPGVYNEIEVGERLAQVRLDEMQTQSLCIQTTGAHRGIYTGFKFKLQAHPTERFNKHENLVTMVRHTINNSGYGQVARGNEEEVYFCEATLLELDTADTVQFRPARITPTPFIRGIHSAVVVGPDNEEIYCDEYGRVKVQFHWDRYGEFDENSSCWIRASQLWAGKDWAGMHIPRIGQEVLVSFLEGDPDQPMITGRVYNNENMPPWGLAGEKTKSGIKSRSTPGGGPDNYNEIMMEDKIGSELLSIQAEKDENILVKNDKTETVGHDETINIGNDRTETVGHDETISVANNRLDTVGMDETRAVMNNRTRTVAKNESVTVTMTRSHTVGINEAITVGGAQEITVGGIQETTVGGMQETTVGAARNVDVMASQAHDIGRNCNLEIGKDYSVDVGSDSVINVGKKYRIEAGDELSIKVGKAELIMKKNGNIQLKGKNFNVKSSGKAKIKASGTITLKGSSVKEN